MITEMNKPKGLTYRIITIMAFSLCTLYSCKKDKKYDFNGDALNKVFFNTGNYTVNSYNSYSFIVKHTPVGSLAPAIKAELPVRSTQNVTVDTKVSYAVDNSLIADYNKDKGTNYVAVPAELISLSTPELTIPSGSSISSEMLTLSVTPEKLNLLTASGYVIPLKIAAVKGDSGVGVGNIASTVYVVITTEQTNLYDAPIATDMTGILNTVRTGWSATVDAVPTSGTLANMFDASTTTSWYITPAKNVSMVVNMAASIDGISGIRYHTSSTNYHITLANIYTSTDGNNWVLQGLARLSIVNAYQYVKFYTPVSARYIKMDVLGWRSATTTRIMFTDFNIYR